MESEFDIQAHLVDVVSGNISAKKIVVRGGTITSIDSVPANEVSNFLIPGFVDSHIHIESSMLLPSQFARAAVVHGTVATVSDPHEIANVCGVAGVELMLRDAAQTCFKFHFGAPCCVPATKFETAGASLDADAVKKMLDDSRIGYLSEVMDYPGVLGGEAQLIAKIAAAKQQNKRIDGHAPGLRGDDARKYFSNGITTDHECFTIDEALDKISTGCRIAIREGSAARNFDALEQLIDKFPDHCMFCSDDKHPDELMLGHINQLAARAVANGRDVMNVLRACSLNPVKHYGLDVGLLQVGDPADFVVVSDLKDFRVLETYIDGAKVADGSQCFLPETKTETINQFKAQPIDVADLTVETPRDPMPCQIRVIEALDGQLVTRSSIRDGKIVDGKVVSDPANDLLKLVVVNRYELAKPAVAFISGFGIENGAIASTVAHDSHNIVATGDNDIDLCNAINAVIKTKGGLSVATGKRIDVLPLPVAGLMATDTCEVVGGKYSLLDRHAKQLGSKMRSPFMTLSFMALLVIPALKLSDKGLFDVEKFEFVPLFISDCIPS